ncbi:YD repeat protein [Streptomyces azureus]|uniref:YD repeat protein n=1 Tax=Streptomyces azureus TaxID=146537 RepID=A0A0K8PUJ6_STRAJ|nr:YD repeat protein [Streptomyces azureus]
MHSGFRPVRREGVPGVATGRTLPAGALARARAKAAPHVQGCGLRVRNDGGQANVTVMFPRVAFE